MGKYLTKQMHEDSKLAEEKRKMKVVCPVCQCTNHFYAFETENKHLCRCGNYVFKDKKSEFVYRTQELLRRNK